MVTTHLSTKGQLTIPLAYRRRMNLTGRQRVHLDQLADGTVVIRPAPSILPLAGTLPLRRPLAAPERERQEVHQQRARRSLPRSRVR
jgi:bifunctional DNA-binding transcriptional regulator/antitoxin component of YhaV-PrlF toxin-antitoxin module